MTAGDAGRSFQESVGRRAKGSRLGPALAPALEPSLHLTRITMNGGSMTKAELVEEVSRVSGSHQEALRGHRRHGLQEHHRRPAPRREDRAAGIRQLPAAQARATQGPNPKTGDKVDVPPKKVPYFKPGKELKELINREPDARRRPATVPPDAPARLSALKFTICICKIVNSDGAPVVAVEARIRDRRDRRPAALRFL